MTNLKERVFQYRSLQLLVEYQRSIDAFLNPTQEDNP